MVILGYGFLSTLVGLVGCFGFIGFLACGAVEDILVTEADYPWVQREAGIAETLANGAAAVPDGLSRTVKDKGDVVVVETEYDQDNILNIGLGEHGVMRMNVGNEIAIRQIELVQEGLPVVIVGKRIAVGIRLEQRSDRLVLCFFSSD